LEDVMKFKCMLLVQALIQSVAPVVTAREAYPVEHNPEHERNDPATPAVRVLRLGNKSPRHDPESESFIQAGSDISADPIVLWSEHGAPAVLYMQEWWTRVIAVGLAAGRARQEVGVLDGGAVKLGVRPTPYPIVHGAFHIASLASLIRSKGNDQKNDTFFVDWAIPVDLDGDGEDELITIYGIGSEGPGNIEVYGAKRMLASWKGAGRGYRHMVVSHNVARIANRRVVHMILRRFSDEPTPPEAEFVVLRIDAAGITEVHLRDFGFDVEDLMGVGAISRPGSNQLDELVVVLTKSGDANGLYFSRHTPDGHILAAPRRLTSRGAGHSISLLNLAKNDVIVAGRDDKPTYLLRLESPTAWFTKVEPKRETGGLQDFLGVIDQEQVPKLLFRAGGNFTAYDLDGRPLERTSALWRASDKATPFYSDAPPQPEQKRLGADLDRDSQAVLVVYSRNRQWRNLSPEEVMAAANRFLSPARRTEIERENKEGVYKRAEDAEDVRKRLVGTLESELKSTSHDDLANKEQYPDPKGLSDWLASIDLPAATSLVLIRDGQAMKPISIPGAPIRGHGEYGTPMQLDWQLTPDALRVVLPMGNGETDEYGTPNKRRPLVKLASGFYLVEWSLTNHGAP
jgi:hypothetical protein